VSGDAATIRSQSGVFQRLKRGGLLACTGAMGFERGGCLGSLVTFQGSAALASNGECTVLWNSEPRGTVLAPDKILPLTP